jgi:RNA polymerase sigma factor (sigma-70 family)
MAGYAIPVPGRSGRPSASLAEVLAAHARGEPGANTLLLAACKAQIEKLARRLLRGHQEIRRGAHDTVDIVSLAWQRLAQALESVRPESEQHLMALAAMQVRRTVIDLSRKFGGPRSPVKHQLTNVVVHDSRMIERVKEAAQASDGLDTLEMALFHEEVDRLPAELRQVFELRFYLGASVVDVARMVACDPRTVKRRWKLAKDQLRARLGPQA